MADTPYTAPPPAEADLRHDEIEYDPSVEPRKSKAWLNILKESEDAFEDWNARCDNIDKMYANLSRLNDHARAREFQLFWANCEVLKPSIYAKAPVPVVVPKFKDRRPVPQAASEVMERCATVAFDLAYINDLMMAIRDDVAIAGRGVAWCRYESGKGNGKSGYGGYSGERVCIDYKPRRDFLHSLSRCWQEVTWVAAASYLTRSEARDRFKKYSGDAYQEAEYRVDKDAKDIGGGDDRERACFWEIWHKGERRVVWVAEGVEDILDESDPHLNLQGFFPCPKPAFGTCQRGSLVPVPDMMQYKDQLDEVNMLTGRIHALSDAVQVKGFYPAGSAEVGNAVETALKINSPSVIMVPVSNWAAFGGSKEIIIWMPIEEIAATITQMVAMRKQVIEDIYQIMGLSDIMRGATDPQETLGAQQLKTEYGSSRVRDKQYELIRIARDLVVIVSEVICEKFADETIIEMSQTQIPTKAMQRQAIAQAQQQLAQQVQQFQQMQQRQPQANGGQPPQPGQPDAMAQAQQFLMHSQQAIEKIAAKPNIEQVLQFMKDQRSRAFVLDIETDSTIIADENAEKQRRTEFVGQLGTLMPQLAQMIAADPGSAQLCGDILKFATAPFRSGRELDGSINNYVEQIKARGEQGKGDDPTTATNKTALQIEQMKQKTEKDKNDAMNALKAQELQMKDRHETMKIQSMQQIEMMKMRQKQQDDAAKAQQTVQKTSAEREAHQMDMVGKQADMEMNRQKMAMTQAAHVAKQQDMQARQSERQAAQQLKAQQPQRPGGPF